MSACEECEFWTVKRVNQYSTGEVIETWSAPSGKGHCDKLGIETLHDFGCNKFMAASKYSGMTDHVERTRKIGHPWQHFVMIPCPDCDGKGDGTRGHRCAGTGLVRLYDDGYIGDEQTRLHPKEKATPPVCMACSKELNREWVNCPYCGRKTPMQAETEVIEGLGSATL